MSALVIDGVTIITSTPSACDNCDKAAVALVTFAPLAPGGSPLTLCSRCTAGLLPASPPAETAPARRPSRKRTRQAGA